MNFGAPLWLWALLSLPVLALLFFAAERRGAARLEQFVAPRLLPQLGATVNRFRRLVRFALVLLGLALAIVALAQPRYGYTYEEVKRKGLDLIIAVDTSRSMLANDVPPNRLGRVKLVAQDLIGELRGDRIGLIAFAGRAFLQAPLTIDYDAAVEALNDLDTDVIPEGGTNISEAITLAVKTFGKSAIGNRALIIFTDGEELAGDASKMAKAAADAGVRIFTVGVGTPEGSLIPLPGGRGGGTAFVKDSSGQVVKSKLDEGRLREIAQATGGKFLPLGDGPDTMRKLYGEGLAEMQAGEIDTKMSRQPIERYQWPLGGALLALTFSLLMSERKRARRAPKPVAAVSDHRKGAGSQSTRDRRQPSLQKIGLALLLSASVASARAEAPGLDAYRNEQFGKAYEQFQQTLQQHPETRATDKIQFDAGAAAYKMKDYSKALQSFSQALLSPNPQLQSRSHYNLGNTLYQRGETQKTPKEKLQDWNNALQHYEQTLKLEPDDKEAKENSEFVKKKIEELKKEQEKPSPTPTPSPSPSPTPNQKNKNDQKNDQDKQQQKDQAQGGEDQKPSHDESQPKDSSGKNDQPQPGESPTPTPSPEEQPGGGSPSPSPNQGGSPSPSPGEQSEPSPSPGENGPSPSPSSGEGEEKGPGDSPAPSATPAGTPDKKLAGDVKGAPQEQKPEETPAPEAEAEAEATPDGQMSQQQAERLLESMKDEEQRVQLDERKKVRRVYKDW
ncbi:MAG TPA: VWA domain-containing protein [Chthoniobacterales bacterium]|nr:VWA domain-containing protein [Chthoniobacterales bacterium]